MHGFLAARIPLLFMLSLILLPGVGASSWADELASWYRSDPRAASYAGVRDRLGLVFSQARRERIPEGLLTSRLREGAAKKVPADRLPGVLRADVELLLRASRIVSRAGLGGNLLSRGASEQALKEVGIYLRAGLPDHLISDLLSAGSRVRDGRESALAACQAIMDLRAVAPVEDADALQIGKLLMASGMQPSGYSSLAIVYGLGMSRGMSRDNLVHDVIINTLSSGGGVAIMNQKIQSTPIAQPLASPRTAEPRLRSSKSPTGHPR